VAVPAMMRDAGSPIAARGNTVTELPPSLVTNNSPCAGASCVPKATTDAQKIGTDEIRLNMRSPQIQHEPSTGPRFQIAYPGIALNGQRQSQRFQGIGSVGRWMQAGQHRHLRLRISTRSALVATTAFQIAFRMCESAGVAS
jgi:hypothetical protein